jgi:ubiquinone/menaquinone biosynthesis C-methylase UbiE
MIFEIIKLENDYDNNTKKVKNFYKKNPFPGYKSSDNKFSILNNGDKSLPFKKMKELFKNNKKILEIGSGTCQLSSYFAIGTNNEICAFDATYESLNEGKKFCKKNQIKNIKFVQGNILKNNFKKNYFDLILCNGVLHHTSDPYLGFKNGLNALKKGGVIVLGLYNKYGRFTTLLLRIIYKIFGKKIVALIDPVTRNMKLELKEREAWIEDQFNHPLEKSYSFKETYEWFKKNNVRLLSSIPKATTLSFENIKKENILDTKKYNLNNFHVLTELGMIFNSYGKDGGLFIFIGVKD